MAKSSAYGTVLNMGAGDVQVETATVVGTITNPGDLAVVITATGMTGSPLTLAIPVVNGVAAVSAEAIRTFLRNDATAAAVRAMFEVTGATDKVILTRKIPMADITLNISLNTGSATGLTEDLTSDATHVGETLAAVAYIQSLGGPGLSLDTEDVTTHDSTSAWEEVVATILRSGELSLDIVYDPNANSHDGTDGGLVEMLANGNPVGFSIVFPGSVTWSFAACVTGFEPSSPHDGALTAAVKLKLTGVPILA
jgi:predicted secreted protein